MTGPAACGNCGGQHGTPQDPGVLGAPLDEMWAWVFVHANGGETVGVFRGKDDAPIPLVTPDEGQAWQMRQIARSLAVHTGRTLRLVRLVRAETVDEVSL